MSGPPAPKEAESASASTRRKPNLNRRLRGLERSATLEINEQSKQLIDAGRTVYRFGFGQSPFPVPASVVEALRDNAHQKDYLPVSGLPGLREAVAGYHRRFNGIHCEPDHVVIGPGSKELIYLMQFVVDGTLLLPSPSWVSYAPQAQLFGRDVRWIETGRDAGWTLTADALDQALTGGSQRAARVLLLNYPCNPTGITYTSAELESLAEVARRHGLVVLADEIYAELHHSGEHNSIATFYPEGTVLTGGLSKWCGAGGWRLGTMLFPQELKEIADAVAIVASETYSSTSAPVQYAAVHAFNGSPNITAYVRGSRRILAAAADWVTARLQQADIDVVKPDGAFYLFPSFDGVAPALADRGLKTSRAFCAHLLQEIGIALLPGSVFGRPKEEMTARLSYVDFDGARALDAVGRLEEAEPIDEAFLRTYCGKVLDGIETLADWYVALSA